MNSEELKKWKDASIRLAEVTGRTKQRKEKLKEAINEFFSADYYFEDIEKIKDWECIVDNVEEYLEERNYLIWDEKEQDFRGKFGSQFKCCVRAAIDMVVQELGFVGGYTKKNLYEAYNEVLPNWIKSLFSEKFFQMPESEYIWL